MQRGVALVRALGTPPDAISFSRCQPVRQLIITDHFSGPGRAIGRLCVCLSVCADDMVSVTLARWSSIIGQSSRSEVENVAKVVSATSSEGFLVRQGT